MYVFGMATSSCVILYSMTRRASVLRFTRVICLYMKLYMHFI